MPSIRLVRQLLVLLLCFASPLTAFGVEGDPSPDATSENGLPTGWMKIVDIPAVKDMGGNILLKGAILKMSTEQGWLVIRRETSEGELEWQVVLAQADHAGTPGVQIDTSKGSLELKYGSYFVREDLGGLRMLRERKSTKSPFWPQLPVQPERVSKGSAGSEVHLTAWITDNWCWVDSGLPNGRSDVWLRLNHEQLADKGYGFNSRGRLVFMFYGGARVQDEGDLLVAERVVIDAAQEAIRVRKLQQELENKPAPGLSLSKWFNSPHESSLDQLSGNVILLDFWGKWCGPCVRNLPHLQALHKKYHDRGLVVIGVHSCNDSDDLQAFLQKNEITFAVAVDSGETAKRYGVDQWPVYFLISRMGKVTWGSASEPPSDTQIEELLKN